MTSQTLSGPAPEGNTVKQPAAERGASFRGILKASALIGASSLVNVVLSAVRMKAMALLLGPAGVGLLGALNQILELTRNAAQLGMNGSGVRQIAEASSSGESRRMAVTVLVLRRAILACATVGALLLVATSSLVSTLSFGTSEHAFSIGVLSVALFLAVVASGQVALLQGTRKVAEQAKVSVYGGLIGTLAAIAIVYMARDRGIAASLVAVAAATSLVAWWYSRREKTIDVSVTADEALRESGQLVKLGLAFLASGLLMSGAAYLVRTMVLRELGLEAAGLYQAAWALGAVYVGFVLNTIGADFYPRLVGVINDHDTCNATVNEQAHASMLLAAPGIIATIVFAPLAVHLFYSAEFVNSIELLRWFCVGMALRVIIWPMGYIVVATKRQVLFFTLEAVSAVSNVLATWWCLRVFGLAGAGIAFMASCVIHAFAVYPAVRRITGFRWSSANLRAGALFLSAIGVAFASQHWLPYWSALVFGTFLTAATIWFCVRSLVKLSAAEDRFPAIRRILRLRRPA